MRYRIVVLTYSTEDDTEKLRTHLINLGINFKIEDVYNYSTEVTFETDEDFNMFRLTTNYRWTYLERG